MSVVALEIPDLIRRAAAGNKQAWDALVEQYRRLVWSILGKFDNLSEAEREDLLQDVFVILLDRGLQRFRGSSAHEFRAYMKTITENEAKSYLRRHGRRFEVLDPFLPDEEDEERNPGPSLPTRLQGQRSLWPGRRCYRDCASACRTFLLSTKRSSGCAKEDARTRRSPGSWVLPKGRWRPNTTGRRRR